MSEIAIIGAGAVGSILYHLIEPLDPVLIGRREEKITLTNHKNELLNVIPVREAEYYINRNKKFDVIFITVKAIHNRSIIHTVERLSHSETTIVICQNGYSQIELFKQTEKYHAVVYISGKKQHKQVTYYQDNSLILPDDTNTNSLKQLMAQTNLNIVTTPEYQKMLFKKLLVNLGINSMTGLTQNTAHIMNDEDILNFTRKLLLEGREILSYQDIDFTEKDIDDIINIYKNYDPFMGTSMYYDMQEKRKTEFEYIQGYFYRESKRHHLKSPVIDLIYTLLKGYSYGR